MEILGCLIPVGLVSIVLFAAYMLDRQRIRSEHPSRFQQKQALQEFDLRLIFTGIIAVACVVLIVGVFVDNKLLGLLGAWIVSLASLFNLLIRYANRKSHFYKQLQKTTFQTEAIKKKAEHYFILFTPFEIGTYLGIFLCLLGFLTTFAAGNIPYPFVQGSSPLIWIGFLLFIASGSAGSAFGKYVSSKIPSTNGQSE
ncbi:MAG: hypothetical protein HY862_03510 [Chloroflexi bacterium]|nr:hypothetical protein [Chloroflexota bacterium]